MEYYTYAYLREDGTPYYIGKGKGRRLLKKGKGEVKPPKDKSRVIKLKQNLTEEEAFKHEIYMIFLFGRKDLGTGILRNKTDGGDGTSGFLFTKEMKEKIILSNKKRMTKEYMNFLYEKRMENKKEKYKLTNENKNVIYVDNLKKFSEENGYCYFCFFRVLRGKRNSHRGWKIEKI
jgi:hypothetical protein